MAAQGLGARAFQFIPYRFFWAAVLSTSFGAQILSVAIAWQVWELTRNPWDLAFIGLVQFAPAFILVLVTGFIADRFSRRRILQICLLAEVGCAISFVLFALADEKSVQWVFITLFVLGVSRAFMRPAEASLAPNLVPTDVLSSAVALTGSAWQMATIIGPAVAGILLGISPVIAYSTALGLFLVSFGAISMVKKPNQARERQAAGISEITAGFRYIWKQKVVFGAISLDLFAVLMGGAVALLPIYASDILQAGPEGLGLLRAAPGVGAIIVAFLMSRMTIKDHAGKVLLFFVAMFGLSTVVFGFSTSLWIAVPALMFVGGFDMISVIIRETILQLWTPDEVRGRVSAVNAVFVGASNELGEFRAGAMAAFVGAVAAVTIGGMATMGVAGTWALIFPGLRDVRTLDKPGEIEGQKRD